MKIKIEKKPLFKRFEGSILESVIEDKKTKRNLYEQYIEGSEDAFLNPMLFPNYTISYIDLNIGKKLEGNPSRPITNYYVTPGTIIVGDIKNDNDVDMSEFEGKGKRVVMVISFNKGEDGTIESIKGLDIRTRELVTIDGSSKIKIVHNFTS